MGFVSKAFTSKSCCEACGRPFGELAKKAGIALSLRALAFNGCSANLSPLEAEIMQRFIRVYPEMVTREWLFDSIWSGGSDKAASNLDVHILHLRRKLMPIGLEILTVYGAGWRLHVAG